MSAKSYQEQTGHGPRIIGYLIVFKKPMDPVNAKENFRLGRMGGVLKSLVRSHTEEPPVVIELSEGNELLARILEMEESHGE